jgi:hypothetical protein
MVVVLLCGLQAAAASAATYRQIVDQYRRDPNGAIEAMLAMPPGGRDQALAEATTRNGWTADELAAAAMMHTDAGLYFLNEHDTAGPAHLALAEKLLSRALDEEEGRAGFVRRWYRTIIAILDEEGNKAEAQAFARNAQVRVADTDARRRASASLDEGIAIEYDGGIKGEFLTIQGLLNRGDNLVQRYFVPAARQFSIALELDPRLDEASVHLGRIRMLEGNDAEAARLFTRATESVVPSVRYLARLFLGATAERERRWADAEGLYTAALEDVPAGQAARLALAHLRDRDGRPEASASIIQQLVDRASVNRIADPWWTYFNVSAIGFDAATSLRVLRAEVSR